MAIITPSQLTFNGTEVRTFAEAVIQRLYTYPALNQYSTIVPNVKAKTQIALLGHMSKVSRLDPGCGTGQYTPTIPMSQKYFNPVDLKIWIQTCWKDFLATFMVYYEREFARKPDLTVTEIFTQWLVGDTENAMLEDAVRIAWFADTAIAAGNLTNGAADVPNYNQLDGYWKKIFAIMAANTSQRVTITQNAATTQAGQQFSATDTTNKVATTYFQNLIFGADTRLRADPNAIILTTQSLADQYLRERMSFTNIPESYTLVQDANGKVVNGLLGLNIMGVPVYVISEWDRVIPDFANPVNAGAYYLPHRAIYTLKTNLQQSLDGGSLDDQTVWNIWYSNDTELSNIKALYKTDVQVIEDYLIRAAY
jgi:hypothetical protein